MTEKYVEPVPSSSDSRKENLIALLQLAAPAILQQLLSSLLQYVDTAMVGRLGAEATATVSTSTSPNWLVHTLPYGFTIGLLAMISQAYGRGDREEMKKLSALSCKITVLLGLVLTFICLGISPILPKLMHAAQEIREGASEYFFIVSLSLLFFTATSVFSSAMHAVKDTRTPMIINLSANVLNVVLNWLFIYRFSMGARGAAWATAVSTTAGGIGMFLAYRRKEELYINLRDLGPTEPALLKKTLNIALPVTGTQIVSCLGYTVFAGMVNSMGVKIFAAHSIALTAEEIFYLPGYGIRTATSALIGIAIGEKNRRKFTEVRDISLIVTILLMCATGLILFFVADPLMRIFTHDPEVVSMGAQALRIVSFVEPFFGLMVAWEGISYGTGKTRSVFIIESLSMWGIRILGTRLVLNAGGGLNAVWGCMAADNIIKAVALSIYGLTHSSVDALFMQEKQV